MPRLLSVSTIAATQRAFLLPFARHFRSKEWQVDALAKGISRCAECIEAFDKVWEIEWSRNPLEPYNLAYAVHRVREVVKTGNYDLVHLHTPVAAFIARYALRGLRARGLKVIYTAHGFHFHCGGHPLKNIPFIALEKLAGRWTDFLVVINQEDRQAALRYGIVPRERLCYMPGIGVDTEALSPEQIGFEAVAHIREELRLPPGEPVFVMVAEFTSRKRHRDALLATARLSFPAHLVLAGTGPLFTEIQALAKKLGIADRVHFLGYRRDIPVLMRAANATILPSEREGLPRSVMESLSLEVPVIGTDIRGTRDLLDGGVGLLVPVGDIEALGQSMTWIVEHPERAREMGRRGRQRVQVGYDLRYILSAHERLYAEALFGQQKI